MAFELNTDCAVQWHVPTKDKVNYKNKQKTNNKPCLSQYYTTSSGRRQNSESILLPVSLCCQLDPLVILFAVNLWFALFFKKEKKSNFVEA